MNQFLKSVNPEKVLFFDIEDVRKSKEVEPGSREFELYRKKTRDRDTDKLMYTEELIEDYGKRAALKMCYTKIVSIGVGFINNGKVHIKALEGTEEEIIKQFCTLARGFDFVSGANILAFDLPMIINNGYRHFDVCTVLPDRFVTSGKKPWNLTAVIDVMDIFKGTHYYNSSLDEICYHFDIPSSKSDLDGSMVSEEYWNNGLEKINSYVKQDVFATINVFMKMRFEPAFSTFIDKNTEPSVKNKSWEGVLKRLNNSPQIIEEERLEISKLLKLRPIVKKDVPILKDILSRIYVNSKMFVSDKQDVVNRKQAEIKSILDELQLKKI